SEKDCILLSTVANRRIENDTEVGGLLPGIFRGDLPKRQSPCGVWAQRRNCDDARHGDGTAYPPPRAEFKRGVVFDLPPSIATFGSREWHGSNYLERGDRATPRSAPPCSERYEHCLAS